MEIKFSKRFYKKLEGLGRNKILSKLNYFVEQLLQDSHNFTFLPKGLWVKSFRSNPNRFKFRVSNKDRIIYELSEDKKTIYFLDYCNHDEQVRTANRLSSSFDFMGLSIDKSEYKESKEERLYDENLLEEAYELLDSDNLEEAEEKFKAAGDIKISKIINNLIKLKNSKNDFYNHTNRTYIDIINPNKRIYIQDILKIFNRLYSEYRVIPGNYIKVQAGMAYSIEIWLKDIVPDKYKIYHDYLKDLVNRISKELNAASIFDHLILDLCLYNIKDNSIYNEYSIFKINLENNMFKPANPEYLIKERSDHNYDKLNELEYHNKKKIIEDTLELLFSKEE